MYKLCKTEQSARRQRELEEGLLTAMENKKYEDILISDLCEQLGITRKVFYRYFSCKDGALMALLDHTLLEFEPYVGHLSRSEEDTSLEMEGYFRFWQSKKNLLNALASNGLLDLLVQKAVEFSSRERRIADRILMQKGRDMRDHVNAFIVCGMLSMMISWHMGGYKETPQQMAAAAAHLLRRTVIPESVR